MLQVPLRLLISSLILFYVIIGKLFPHKAEGYNVVSTGEALVRDLGAGEDPHVLRSRKMILGISNVEMTVKAKGNGASGGILMSATGKLEEEVAKGQHRVRSLLSDEEKNMLGFVAFNADYHGPRHHPPKNN